MCRKDDFSFGIGILAGVVGGVVAGILLAPKKGEDSCKDVELTIKNLIETQAPNVKSAKKQALDAIDLVKYKIEKKIKSLSNALKSEKLEKAKKLEESDIDYDFN